MTERIISAYRKLGFEEIMLSLNLVINGDPDKRSILQVNSKHDVRKCVTLMENLIEIIKNLVYVSTSRIEFEDSASDDRKFRLSTVILRIVNSICSQLYFDTPDYVPDHVRKRYRKFIKPLVHILGFDLLVLKEWLFDLIHSEFSLREDFSVITIGCGDPAKIPDLPRHPYYGPFNSEMKDKFEHIKSSLRSGNYQCKQCKTSLNVSNIAIWAECRHICLCANCAFFRFSRKINDRTIEREEDGSISHYEFVRKKDCPQCHATIFQWSKGKHMIDAENHSYGVLGSSDNLAYPAEVLEQEIESLRRIICLSMKSSRTVSCNFIMLLNETVFHSDLKYKR